MKILVYLGHPAHFHLYKNAIENWKSDGHEVFILIKKKDILEDLLKNADLPYYNILEEGRKDSRSGMFLGMLKRARRLYSFCRKNKPDILTGTSVENSFVGKLLKKMVVNVNEDDADVVPLYAKLGYPWADAILNPRVCDSGKWNVKATKYESYQELAYLHPNHFKADKKVVEKYFSTENPYFIIRFAKLTAHHDSGIRGINAEVAEKIVNILKPHGNIYITSERPLEPQFEKYRMTINPLNMHHVMAFAQIYIGDSQTMAAEAGVLGVPFVRFNDFVGRIGYLRELEDEYQLGYGVKTDEISRLYTIVENLVNMDNREEVFKKRQQKMLFEKIDFAKFLTWYIESFPESKKIMTEDSDYQYNFR
jgi:predicted glycosyltransferase